MGSVWAKGGPDYIPPRSLKALHDPSRPALSNRAETWCGSAPRAMSVASYAQGTTCRRLFATLRVP